MSAIDNYGEFDLPEEKTRIEVVEDPVKTVLSCYEMYCTHIEKSKKFISIEDKLSKFYEKGLKILEGKEKLKIEKNQTKQILDIIFSKEDEEYVSKEMFLSALINETANDFLIVNKLKSKIDPRLNYHLEFIGYQLKKGKTLILGQRISSNNAGYRGKGGIIINRGDARNLGSYYLDGILVNLRRGEDCFSSYSQNTTIINTGMCGAIGNVSKIGLVINLGNTQVLGNESENEVIINLGSTEHFGTGAKNSILINMKDIKNALDKYKTGEKYYLGIGSENCILISTKEIDKAITPYKQQKIKLEQKMQEIEFLKTLKEENDEEAVRQIKNFNFKKWEEEVKEIAKEIDELC